MLVRRAAISQWLKPRLSACAALAIVAWDARMRFRRSTARAAGAPSIRAHQRDCDVASAQKGVGSTTLGDDLIKTSPRRPSFACCIRHVSRWRPRFLALRPPTSLHKLSGIVQGEQTFILEYLQGRGLICRASAQTGAPPGIPPPYTTFPFSSPATGGALPSTQSCRRTTAPRSAALAVIATAKIISSSTAEAISAFALKAKSPFTPCPRPASPPPRASPPHQQRQCLSTRHLKQWLNLFNASPPKPTQLSCTAALSKPGIKPHPKLHQLIKHPYNIAL